MSSLSQNKRLLMIRTGTAELYSGCRFRSALSLLAASRHEAYHSGRKQQNQQGVFSLCIHIRASIKLFSLSKKYIIK